MSSTSPDSPSVVTAADTHSPGLQLRQAREAAGLSLADASRQLRLKERVLEAIERDDLAALGAPVFARGFVLSYARLLKQPEALVDRIFPREEVVVAVPLQSHSTVSHGRYLLDRYARRLVYVALTAAIVVPVLLLATRDHLPDPETLLAPLDAPLLATVAQGGDDHVAGQPTQVEFVGPPAAAEQAIMASLTPFYSAPRVPAPAPAVAAPEVGLVLEVIGTSWVEVTAHDGSRLAHDLLRAGAQLRFEADAVARVLLGNAEAVRVRFDGQEVDTTPYRRANVARFTLSSEGLAVPNGG